MKTDQIKLLYEYNYWANWRILTACAQLGPEQYIASATFGSVRANLIHIVSSEWAWRLLLQGNTWPEDLTQADLPTLDALRERWHAEQREMMAYIGRLSDEDLNGIIRYPLSTGTVRERVLWHCLLHLVNHGTQHRSEAAALLTSCGQSPGDVDFTLFLNEHFNLPS